MSNEIEVRAIDNAPALSGDGNTLIGYAAVFNSLSEDLGGFREVIKPGAFARYLASNGDVRALIDHDDGKLLGRTSSGTLKLSEDAKGLRYEIALPDTSHARDLKALMARGDVSKSSFGFRVAKDGQRFLKENGTTVRELHNVNLRDVSPVTTYPAYSATSVALRHYEQHAKEVDNNMRRIWLRQIESEM